ncbi:uncharacterized protein KRP23_12569 [Phytophthora ramorum]|uniref:uncharacterized protein n=1 Tax=Phytophthora ramorum TaxID=164328 RepID=UPI00309B8074|nr:hypothetical protein KRP23_12569 [Phytophthora ramorum]
MPIECPTYKSRKIKNEITRCQLSAPLADSPPSGSIPYHSPQNKAKMLNALQPPKDLYRTLRETLFVRFVLAVLTPFTFLLGTLLRSHYRKVNGDRTPGLTRYRQ